jgi:hypothetical protein
MKKTAFVGAAFIATMVGLCSTTGCSSAPEEDAEEKATASEDALGRDPANCYMHHSKLRRWNVSCSYQAPPTPAQRDQLNDFLTHVSGIGSCVGVVVSIGALAGGTMTVVLAPASLAAAGAAVASAAGCGQYIGNALRGMLAGWSCTSFEVSVSYRDHYDTCAMACGGSQRLASNLDCYCGRTPLACQDAPAPTGTPSPGTCHNNGNGADVARGQCSPGYSNGYPNGLVYKCMSSGQDWRQCPAGTPIGGCC